MSQKNALINAVGFEYLLLESYKKIGLSENETITCLMIHHLSEQGNGFIPAESLELKMNLPNKEIDSILNGLLKKGYLIYENDAEGKLSMSLLPLEEKIKKEFAFSLTKEQNDSFNKEKEETLKRLISLFEEKFSRTLTPLEISTITEWIENKYSEDAIRNALLDAVKSNKKTIKTVNRILVARRQQDDIQKEGASAVNDRWDKSVEETVEAIKSLWGDPNGEK